MEIVACSLSHKGQPRVGLPTRAFKSRAPNIYRSTINSSVKVQLFIDPLSCEGQRLIDLVLLLRRESFSILLLPTSDASEADGVTAFSSSVLGDDHFSFTLLNGSTTYSLIPDVPLTWQSQRKECGFDMDNVVVEELGAGTHEVVIQLTAVLMEGAVTDNRGNAGGGMEVTTDRDETRVISRNGYWQLKAQPGKWHIHTNTEETFEYFLDGFTPRFRYFQNSKRISGARNRTAVDDGKIHIFVVSSGLLYERLMRIMMLSVIKHTKHSVKFWILGNFVSPQHMKALPEFGKKYGFEYELVSYQWPRWLPQETARQRVFWGYKILFLDVMFPNNLKRVIYVDSDQVVRADMMELMELDMKGAAYGFTPFCEDRPEMEEYRFWQDGYWRNLLNGRKYHISALFVVDLDKFREREAGDVLRKAYWDLHKDKHSLSNLDQNLPNVIQDRVDMFDLPQEWLWCGSWCSDETMDRAKTIDLCNNPRTKEGKLEYAKRTIKEWIPYDREANGRVYGDENL